MVRLDQGKYIGALLAWMQFVKKITCGESRGRQYVGGDGDGETLNLK